MFKGIQLLIALSVFTSAYADEVSDAIQHCRSNDGTVLQERVGERRLVDTVENGREVTRIYRTCYDVLCYKATAGVGSVDFNNIADFRASSTVERGAAQIAFDNNVCTDDREVTTRGDIFDNGGGSGSGEAGAGISVTVNGELYVCNNATSVEECLAEHGISANADWTYRRAGRDGNGRNRWVITRGGGGGAGGDVDIRIGRDIDLDTDGDGRISRRGGWIYVNGNRYRCSSSKSTEECLRRIGISVDGEIDIENCATCGFRVTTREARSSGWGGILSGVAEVAGALAPPIFGYLGVRAQANAYRDSHRAWAGAAEVGFEQCQLMQTSYVQNTYSYLGTNELPDREVLPPECNGYQLGAFPGMQGLFGNGYGGFGNAYIGGGYSPQFMAGMYGNGMGYNPYMSVTGMGMNPYAGLGFQGNLNLNSLLGLPPGGVNFGAGMNTGYNTGFGATPGWGGGWNGGFNGGLNGGFTGMNCVRAPCPGQGGYGGWNGGFNGGLNGGFTGMPGGWGGNATMNPWGGATAWGGAQWPNNGGSYWNNTGGWNGGGWGAGGNGSVNGQNWYAVQNAQNFNAQATQYGSMNQQIALQNQAGQAAYNTQYGAGQGYGYAGYSPGNMGYGMTGGYGLGGNFGFNFGLGM